MLLPQKRSKLLEPRGKHAHLLPPVGSAYEKAARAGAGAGAVSLREKGGAGGAVNRTEHMLAGLAMGLLVASLKRETLKVSDKTVAEMLDPFVAVTQRMLLSTHDTIVAPALAVLSHLIKAAPPLPALRLEHPTIVANIFFLLLRAGSSAAGGAVPPTPSTLNPEP